MARPGGKEVGRVSIRAVPDATKFREDLKRMLERVERTVKVSLPTEADTRPADSALRRFQKHWNGQSVTLATGVATGGAATQMRFLTRPRFVPLIVRVQKASIAKATALLAAFSGARVASDLVKNLTDRLANLDRALPKAAFVSTSIANVTSVVLNALGGILTFGAGFGQLLGTLAAAPGILAGMAVGGTTLALALADTKTQLAVLAPAFERLQNVVSANFWSGARKSILELARGTLPELQAGLGRTATQLGSWASSLAQELAATLGGGRIKTLFDPLVRSIEIASTGLGGFVRGVVSLGEVGGSFLPRLAQWVADLSNRFGAFIEQATSSGALQQFIETGITAAKQFGSILQSVGSIFVGLTTAAAGGGATGFGALAASLAAVATIVNGPAFQTALSTIFAGAETGATGLAAALGPIGSMLATLAPTIASILTGSGQVVGQVLGEIASALSSPVFAQGLQAFFDGILTGIAAIAPVLPALANAFGTLLGFAGALAAELGPVLGAVLQALAPVLVTLLAALKPILPILGGALIKIVEALAPLVLSLVEAILPLISVFGELIGPVLEPLIAALTTLLTPIIQIATLLIDALSPAFGVLLPLLAEVLTMGFGPLGEVLTALMPIFGLLAAQLKLSMTVIAAVVKTVVALLKGDFESIGKIWEDVWTGVMDFGKSIFNSINSLLEGFINGAIDLINGLTSKLQPFLDGLALSTGGVIDIKLAKIPHVALPRLETGGDVLGSRYGTAAILGENFQAESVVNRGRMNDMLVRQSALMSQVVRRLAGAPGQGATFNVYEAVSPDATAKAVIRRMNRKTA